MQAWVAYRTGEETKEHAFDFKGAVKGRYVLSAGAFLSCMVVIPV